MLKKILIAFATLVALVLAIGLALPSKYRVERSTTLRAPPEAIYAYVANLQRWQEWTPWSAKRYPGSQWMFGGPEVGVGAVHSWSGKDVGNGTLSLTQADPKTGVAYDMSVEQGRYLLHGRISFEPTDSGTRVTWVDEGSIGANPLAHYLVPLIQSRLGGDMAEALARLQKLVEANPLPAPTRPTPSPAPVEQASAPPQPPVSAHSAPPPPPVAEGSQGATPPKEGTEVPAPPAEGSHASAPPEAAPTTVATTPPGGEPAPASQGTATSSGEPVPAQVAPSGESVPPPPSAPAPSPAGASTTPTQS